jgi:hypothetical protein
MPDSPNKVMHNSAVLEQHSAPAHQKMVLQHMYDREFSKARGQPSGYVFYAYCDNDVGFVISNFPPHSDKCPWISVFESMPHNFLPQRSGRPVFPIDVRGRNRLTLKVRAGFNHLIITNCDSSYLMATIR